MHSCLDPTTPDLRTWRLTDNYSPTLTPTASTDLCVELVVHDSLEAPGSVTAGG